MQRIFFLGTVLSLVLPSVARAACPGTYATAACDAGLGNNICWDASGGAGTAIECDTEANGPAAGSEARFITSSSTQFRAWGTESNGNQFCCEITVVDGCGVGIAPVDVLIDATDYSDELRLQDGASSNLKCAVATVYGDASSDWIWGSRDTSSQDYLHGESGDDTIFGADGDDFIYGDIGADTCWGGAGHDTIYLGAGDDRAKGEAGDDTIHGEAGDDKICGQDHVDTLYGGDDDDLVYGGTSTDVVDGGAGGADECGDDPADSPAFCEAIITTCPW